MISLGNNRLTGKILDSHWEGLESLEFLDLSNNSLDGEIPRSLFSLPSLVDLHLSNNRFSGSIRDASNSSYSPLGVIELHNNHLEGPIPRFFFELKNVSSLKLSSNKFSDGQIPRTPTPAVFLDFSSNNSSTLPNNVGNSLVRAILFSASNNRIMGTIPPSFCNASYLRVINLSNNSLHGEIPSCLLQQSEMRVLNLRRNNLGGDITDKFPVDCPLETLDLSWNNLQGKVPKSLSRCTNLEILNIGNNELNDVFPCLLKNSSSLRVLVLNSNKFHGNISCLKENINLTNLQIINIASNNLSTGALPESLFRKLEAMRVDVDRLHHSSYFIPSATNIYYQDSVTVNAKGQEKPLEKILNIFKSIDFSHNNFFGAIPQTVGELKSLFALNLLRNGLSGDIPSSIGNLKAVESLDLSWNNLGSLTFLSTMNFSYNQLVGRNDPGRRAGK